MIVYRITLEKYTELKASGRQSRWFSEECYVIYTSENAALACLETVVHRDSSELANLLFKIISIEIPDEITIIDAVKEYKIKDLLEIQSIPICREFGDDWYARQKSCILKVPSVIIENSHNFLINTKHPDFEKIKIISIKDFSFDKRIKQ